ncbi:MAG TPA: hypothetical protein VF669_23355 [Tepidisphaeraceae bacterium]|jgi:hypothetical protein
MWLRSKHVRLIALSAAAFFASPLRGDVSVYVSVDEYRRTLDDCDGRLSRLGCDIAAARAALDQAVANQQAAASNAAAAGAQAQISSRCIAQLQGKLDLLNQSIPILRQRAADARAAYDQAGAASQAASDEVLKYQTAARSTFESSPAFMRVTTDLASAKAGYDQEVRWTLDALRSTETYAELFEQMEEREDAVNLERSRTPVDQPALEAASMRWMDAVNALNRYKADAIAADPDVRGAQAQVNAIDQARQELVNRFNADVSSDPALKNLIAASQSAQQNVQLAAKTANSAAADLAAREQDLANTTAALNTEIARLNQANADAAAWATAANQYAVDAASADSYVRTLCSREYYVRRERDCASDNLRVSLARCEEDRRREYADRYRGRDHDRDSNPRDSRDAHDDRGHGDGRGRDTDHRQEPVRSPIHIARDESNRYGRPPEAQPLSANQQRENLIASRERAAREDLAARHVRDSREQDLYAKLPRTEQREVSELLTDARRQRELDRQRASLISTTVTEPAQPARVASATAAPEPVATSASPTAPPASPPAALSQAESDRQAKQRQQVAIARAGESRPGRNTPVAHPITRQREDEQKPTPAAQPPQERQTRAERERQRQQQPQAEPQKPTRSGAAEEARARAAGSRESSERQAREARERDARQAEAQQRSRAQREEQAKAGSEQRSRSQREAQAKSDDEQRARAERESQASAARAARAEQSQKSESSRRSDPPPRSESQKSSDDTGRGRDTPRSSRPR